MEEFYEGQKPIRLEHVVSVFTRDAELQQDLDYEAEDFRQMLQLAFRTNRNALANVDQIGDELELAH